MKVSTTKTLAQPKRVTRPKLYLGVAYSKLPRYVAIQKGGADIARFHKSELRLLFDCSDKLKNESAKLVQSKQIKSLSNTIISIQDDEFLNKLSVCRKLLDQVLDNGVPDFNVEPLPFEINPNEFLERVKDIRWQVTYNEVPTNTSRKSLERYPVLSLDGGGIRGILEGKILQRIEGSLPSNRPLSSCFNVFAGTSTGGILALGLVAPKQDKVSKQFVAQNKFNARSVTQLYLDPAYTSKIFMPYESEFFSSPALYFERRSPIWMKLLNPASLALEGAEKFYKRFLSPQFSDRGIKQVFDNVFGEARLNDCLASVVVTSYSMKHNRPYLFSNIQQYNPSGQNAKLFDVARSTSAAPTYFPAHPYEGDYLVDGGVFANNPVHYAAMAIPNGYKPLIVSLGTGTLHPNSFNWETGKAFEVAGRTYSQNFNFRKLTAQSSGSIFWAKQMIDIATSRSSEVQHQLMQLQYKEHDEYFRLNPVLDAEIDLADVGQSKHLEEIADAYIETQERELGLIKDMLLESCSKQRARL